MCVHDCGYICHVTYGGGLENIFVPPFTHLCGLQEFNSGRQAYVRSALAYRAILLAQSPL